MRISLPGRLIVAVMILVCALVALSCHSKSVPDSLEAEQESNTPRISLRESLRQKNGHDIPHTQIAWSDLSKLDYKNGTVPKQLKTLEGQTIKLPGFIVPLSDSYGPFDEFLIVPDQMACIHAPPPPPNQMLMVKTKKPLPIELSFYPLWFYGHLVITKTDSFYGAVGYQLELKKLELYEEGE